MAKASLQIFTDGGARGNPGPAAVGFVVKNDRGQTVAKVGKYIGKTTNNIAEYQAVIQALKWVESEVRSEKWEVGREVRSEDAERNAPRTSHFETHLAPRISRIDFHIDSKLIVNQLNGLYKIKNARLRNLIIKVRELEREVKLPIHYHHISREKNKEADSLVNQVLNCQRVSQVRND